MDFKSSNFQIKSGFKFPHNLLFLLIIFIALFFRLYHLNARYTFEWDQEDDAIKVNSMISEVRPRLIGPRVANENGFFVGPFHYYFLTPFYILTQGHPLAGAYASIFVSLLSILIIYIFAFNLFGPTIALVTTLLISVTPSLTSWNVMYAPIIAFIAFYFCLRLVSSQKVSYPLLFLFIGLSSTIHLVAASIIFPISVAYILGKNTISKKILLKSLIFFIIPLIPLIIFDLRNHFLILTKAYEFLFSHNPSSYSIPFLFLRSFWRGLTIFNISSDHIFLFFLEKIIIITSLIFGIFQFKNKQRWLVLTWILTPFLFLFFYKGSIPEYYYGLVISFYPLFLATLLVRVLNKYLLALFLAIIFIYQFNWLQNTKALVSLTDKQNLVRYLVSQDRDPIFNVSYDLPLGQNVGYSYFFNYYRKFPQNTPQGHLYSIVTIPTSEIGELVYKSGSVGIIRK